MSPHAVWTRIRARDPEGLTPRERKVVDLERRGCTRRVIAAVLGLSVKTVAVHVWKAAQRGVRLRRPVREQRQMTAAMRREALAREARKRSC